ALAQQRLAGCGIAVKTPVLVVHRLVPVQTERRELMQDAVGGTGYFARLVEIVNAHQPLAAGRTRVEPADQCRYQRAEVQGPRGCRRETSAIGSCRHGSSITKDAGQARRLFTMAAWQGLAGQLLFLDLRQFLAVNAQFGGGARFQATNADFDAARFTEAVLVLVDHVDGL